MNNTSGNSAKHATIVGGGISGLTAAYRLHRAAERAGVALDITVLEASERSGGVIETIHADGFTLERGPDSIITEKPWAIDLCRDLGIADEIKPTRREPRGSFIVSRGKLRPVPDGLHLMAPARLGPFAASNLMSWGGKIRALGDLVIPPNRDHTDESLASFVRRRLGSEALDRLAQPMVGGIYTADPEKLSLAATMPRFIEMERKYGSVIRGLMAARRKAGVSAKGPRYDLFVSPRTGTEVITKRLTSALPSGTIRNGVAVTRLEQREGDWELTLANGTLRTDAVCLCTPAYTTASILSDLDGTLSAELNAIEYASATTVNLVYPREAIAHPLNGFGFVVPAIEKRDILACTFSSVKYADRAPQGKTLIRAFVGGAMAPEKFAFDDRETLTAVKRELADLIGVQREPERTLISRYARSMPQYHVGHLARIDRVEAAITRYDRLELAGNAYHGTGIPDCVRTAGDAAERLFSQLFSTHNQD